MENGVSYKKNEHIYPQQQQQRIERYILLERDTIQKRPKGNISGRNCNENGVLISQSASVFPLFFLI